MASINVAVHGALGKMGQEVLRALTSETGLTPVGAIDELATESSLQLPDSDISVPLASNIADLIEHADVVVDFSRADGAMQVIRTAAPAKVNVVVGTTGLSDTDIEEANTLANAHEVGIIIAPNFALGAVLMMHLAKLSARFFDYADLTEMHSEGKLDSPSGTAIAIAKAVSEGKNKSFILPTTKKELISGTRGGAMDGISIHSVRMQGRVAHHRHRAECHGQGCQHGRSVEGRRDSQN